MGVHVYAQVISLRALSGQEVGITLDKADRDPQIKALVAMGLEKETAEDVVHSCRGSLNPIRRHPALVPVDYRKPDWASPKNSEPLLAALLAGAWVSDNTNDCDSVAQLAGVPYEELEKQLHMWAMIDDHPVRLVGNVWQIASRQDAWSLLSPFINASVLERFGQVITNVFQELDPRFELSPEEIWMANVHSKVVKHSGYLRQGLAEMLAMLASYGDRDCQIIGEPSLQDWVSWWVRQLLIENMSGHHWYSLNSVLAYLGEAAPDTFLEAVETGLQGEDPPLMALFVDEGVMGGCPHANLLWALEGISWNLEHLTRVVHILAKLSRLDYRSSYPNHPSESLVRIFQGWLPQTRASLDDRLKIIDFLMRSEPEAGWKLLLDLLPERRDISTRIHRPKFRDWADEWTPDVTQDEYYQHIVEIVERVLLHVDGSPDTRWPELLEKIPQIPNEFFDAAVSQLKEKNIDDFSEDAVTEMGNILRQIVSHHRKFADANGALPKDAVDQLDEILSRFTPDDLIKKHQSLFDDYLPNLTEPILPRDCKQREKLVRQIRKNALEEIWDAQQALGIVQLALSAKYPAVLGTTLGSSSFTCEIEEFVLSWLGGDNNSLDQTAKAYLFARYRQNNDWLEIIREQYSERWTDEIWAAFCLGLPFNKAVFDFLETLPSDVASHYWKKTGYYLQKDDEEYANWVIEQLMEHRRPVAAIHASAHYLIIGKTTFSDDLLARVLELAAIEPTDHELVRLDGYEIVEIFKAIQFSGDVDHERLGRIEWMYLPIFRHNDMQPLALMKEIHWSSVKTKIAMWQ